VKGEEGSALVIVMLVSSLLLVLGGVLMLSATTETHVAANVRNGTEALHAADAGLERAIADLAGLADWDAVLAGAASSFVDGAPGARRLPDGAAIDLREATNELRCGTRVACTDAAMDGVTAERPWGRNNPRWQPFAYGPVARLLPAGAAYATAYVVVWIGDDPGENDGNPLTDGRAPERVDASNPENLGRDVLRLVAVAFGPGSTRRTVEATVVRTRLPVPGVRTVAWREMR
jgi:hypothetical protein